MVGWVDSFFVVQGHSISFRTRPLIGLNGSTIVTAAFEEGVPQRAYAVTADLDLLVIHVPDKRARDAQVCL